MHSPHPESVPSPYGPEAGWKEVRGTVAILSFKRELQILAKQSGQDAVLDALEYFLSVPYFLQEVPKQVLRFVPLLPTRLLKKRTKENIVYMHWADGVLVAAVFLMQYKVLGIPTRCFAPLDEDGFRCVIAAEERRIDAGLQAASELIRRGAFLVQVSVSVATPTPEPVANSRNLIASQIRSFSRELVLAATLDATLAGMTRNTRHNFRRARSQLAHCFPVYVENAQITASDLADLNQHSLYTTPLWVAEKRYALSREIEHGVVVGLRDRDKRWLSLLGGHREEDRFCLDWQMNRSGLGHISVATAMRSFLIEEEAKRGTRLLRFERGTTHPIQHAFRSETSMDIVFASRSIGRSLAGFFAGGIEGGPFTNVLSSPTLDWHHSPR